MTRHSGDKELIAKDWNAGDAGCGALVMGLKHELDQIEAGDLLKVTARGEGASVDLPSWCGITGHELVAADHPIYVLRKHAC